MNLFILSSFATLLITKDSYNYISFVFSLVVLAKLLLEKKKINLGTDGCVNTWFKYSVGVLSACFIIHLVYMLVMDENIKQLDNPSRILMFMPLAFYAWNKKSTLSLLRGATWGAIIGGCIASYGAYVLGSSRGFPRGYMVIQAGDMAMSLGLFALIGFWYAYRKNIKSKYIFLLGYFCGIWGSLLSGSRGGWIILVPALVIILLAYRQVVTKSLLAIVLIGTAGLVFINGITSQHSAIARYQQMEKQVQSYEYENNSKTSVRIRFNMWKAAALAIKEKPLVGWGYSGAQAKKVKQAEEGVLEKKAVKYNHVHNQYLNDWLERGILGLAAGLGIFLVPLYYFYQIAKEKSTENSLYAVALIGVVHVLATFSYGLTQGFLEHNSGSVFYFFVLMLLLGITRSVYSSDER